MGKYIRPPKRNETKCVYQSRYYVVRSSASLIFPVIKYSFSVFCMSSSSISEDFYAPYLLILNFQYKFLSHWHTRECCIYLQCGYLSSFVWSLQPHAGFSETLCMITRPHYRCNILVQFCVLHVSLIWFNIWCYWDQVCSFWNELRPCLACQCLCTSRLPISEVPYSGFAPCSTDRWIHSLNVFFCCC